MTNRFLVQVFRLGALVLALGLGTLPLGCASTEEYVQVREPTPDNPLPESTRARLQECADTWADELQPGEYSVRFDLKMTAEGHIRDVQRIGSKFDVRDMEICMIQALQAISVPRFIVEKAQSELDSKTTPGKMRGFIADTTMMTAAEAAELELLITRLGPFFIRAGAAGLVIFISVVLVAEAIKYVDSERSRCKQVKDECIVRCTEDLIPSQSVDGMPYHDCLRKCLEAQNCWKIFNKPTPGY